MWSHPVVAITLRSTQTLSGSIYPINSSNKSVRKIISMGQDYFYPYNNVECTCIWQEYMKSYNCVQNICCNNLLEVIIDEKRIYKKIKIVCFRGVMDNVLDYEFELQSCLYVHFRTKTLGNV